jgi:hypothetical protein
MIDKSVIHKGAIDNLFSSNYQTLIVSGGACSLDKFPQPIDPKEYEIIPSEWVIQLKNNRPCVGREEGFTYLTRKGWEANKARYETKFTSNPIRDKTWEDVLEHVEEHFKRVDRSLLGFIKNLESKLSQAKAIQQEMSDSIS